jgi:hypothetical protein
MKPHLEPLESRTVPDAVLGILARNVVYHTEGADQIQVIKAMLQSDGRGPTYAEHERYEGWAAEAVLADRVLRYSGDDAAWLGQVFGHLLSRQPGTVEAAQWEQQIQAHGRAFAAAAIIGAPEALFVWAGKSYRDGLGREISPYTEFWVWAGTKRADIDWQVWGSDEFFAPFRALPVPAAQQYSAAAAAIVALYAEPNKPWVYYY